jgi:hypothetical protein
VTHSNLTPRSSPVSDPRVSRPALDRVDPPAPRPPQKESPAMLSHYPRLVVIGLAVLGIALRIPLAVAAQGGEQPPSAPSTVEAAHVTLRDGTAGVRVSWTDTADTELGFRVVDQDSGQEYDALPNTEPSGAVVSLTLPLPAGCFRVFAYNNYGASPLSDMACTPGALPATGGEPTPAVLLISAVAGMLLAAGALALFSVTARTRSSRDREELAQIDGSC